MNLSLGQIEHLKKAADLAARAERELEQAQLPSLTFSKASQAHQNLNRGADILGELVQRFLTPTESDAIQRASMTRRLGRSKKTTP